MAVDRALQERIDTLRRAITTDAATLRIRIARWRGFIGGWNREMSVGEKISQVIRMIGAGWSGPMR